MEIDNDLKIEELKVSIGRRKTTVLKYEITIIFMVICSLSSMILSYMYNNLPLLLFSIAGILFTVKAWFEGETEELYLRVDELELIQRVLIKEISKIEEKQDDTTLEND
jgi:hypothetical protein